MSNQLDYVAGDQLVDRDRQASAVALPYGCLHRHRPAQSLNRILSTHFLDKIKSYADRDNRHDDEEARDVAGCRG